MAQYLYLETMGCQMNVHDSERIVGIMAAEGFERTYRPEEADLLLLNTCSVREKPHQKAYSKLGELQRFKQARGDVVIGVCGCMAQTVPEEIVQRAPYVDLLVGPRSYEHLAQAVRQVQSGAGRVIYTELNGSLPEGLPLRRAPGVCAWVTAMYGCNNYCSYCIVPYARGPERSRKLPDIVAEVEGLVGEGYREVTLLGQNVNTYGADRPGGPDFADLLAAVSAVPGLQRVRFTTSHPKDCSDKLIAAVRDLGPVCEHLHLPVQAGDDEVLRRMGRGYTAGQYRELVARCREAVPDCTLTTDVMVGFPGETERQFERTLALFEELRYDQAFMFKYCDRPGTAAAALPDKVGEEEKQRRLERLIALQNEIGRERSRELIGQTVEVLVEARGARGQLRGRTRGNKLTLFDGPDELIGKLVSVRVTEGFVWGLKACRDEPA